MRSNVRGQQGFSLLELSIVLLIAGLLVAGVWQLTSNMQQQRSDQSVANEVRTVTTALERFLVDQQANFLTALPAAGTSKAQLANTLFSVGGTGALDYFRINYLPGGANFPITNYNIGVFHISDINVGGTSTKPVFRGLVIYTPTNTLTDNRLSRIASLVGSQGGMIPAAGTTCPGVPGAAATGVFGSWCVQWANYGIAFGVGGSSVSKVAGYTTTVDAQMNTNLLSRLNTGNQEANTMHTDLLMSAVDATNTANTTEANVLRYPAGIVMNLTTAILGQNCAGAANTIAMVPNGLNIANNPNTPNPVVPQSPNNDYINMVVTGRTAAGTTNFTLLQCTDVAGVAAWQNAIPSTDNRQWYKLIDGFNFFYRTPLTAYTNVIFPAGYTSGGGSPGNYIGWPRIYCAINAAPYVTTPETIRVAGLAMNGGGGSGAQHLIVSTNSTKAVACILDVRAAYGGGGDPQGEEVGPGDCVQTGVYSAPISGSSIQGSFYADVPSGDSWCAVHFFVNNASLSIFQ